MINAEYLFDKKIVWVGDRNICADNIDDFINKLTNTLKFLGVYTDSINNSLRYLKRAFLRPINAIIPRFECLSSRCDSK